jgi:hypothetical protein
MAQRNLEVDRDTLLRAITARGEQLLGTWLELADGTLHALVDGDESSEGRAFEARMDANPDGFCKVPLYAREYRLMGEFVETVEDDALAATLDAALAGQEAFRRFDAVLGAHPEAQRRWHEYRHEALVAWASAWLRSQGIAVPWVNGAASTVELPVILGVLLARGPVTHTAADRNQARTWFVQACREVCELSREPFRTSDVRGRSRFLRAGVEVVHAGLEVTLRATS